MAELNAALGRTDKDVSELSKDELCQLIRNKTGQRNIDQDKLPSSKPDEDLPSFVPYNLLTQHSIPDKSIADCAEALIGAYLSSTGQRGALTFMSWLGLDVLPRDKETGELCNLPKPTSPLLRYICLCDVTEIL